MEPSKKVKTKDKPNKECAESIWKITLKCKWGPSVSFLKPGRRLGRVGEYTCGTREQRSEKPDKRENRSRGGKGEPEILLGPMRVWLQVVSGGAHGSGHGLGGAAHHPALSHHSLPGDRLHSRPPRFRSRPGGWPSQQRRTLGSRGIAANRSGIPFQLNENQTLWFLLLFLASQFGMQDLSSPTRDRTPALGAQSLNHWTAREVPRPSISKYRF